MFTQQRICRDPETHPAFMEDPKGQIEAGNPLAVGMDMLKIPGMML
jgi:hypothetical protein